jgi:glucosyl-3-phosphoglycerate synthase
MVPAEMDRPALAVILDELCKVRWIDTLVISLNRAKAEDYQRGLEYFERYPFRKVVLWTESPAVMAFVSDMAAAGLYTGEPGKGRACWLAIGLVLAENRASYIAFQDADVINYTRWMLGRLVLPAIEPTVDFDFVKAYYARVSNRLHGRVTRLLLTPLLGAFTRLIGQDPYIGYLAAFRYALAGEFTIKRDLAEKMRLPCDWGLEIVTLFEALRHRAPGRLCQVEIADRYDHKHQDLSGQDPTQGLNRMARDVIKHLLRTLAAAGVNLAPGLLMSLLAAYQRQAQDAVSASYAVAVVNHLQYDRHGEEQSVQVFTEALRASIDEFLVDPLGPPLVPNWSRVWAGVPDASARLLAAVERGGEPPLRSRR